mgnify:CR=1 FL=1
MTNISKIQSESNSQRTNELPFKVKRCDQYFKDTIWKQFTTRACGLRALPRLWPIFQRYNLKAIHNWNKSGVRSTTAVTNISKIQSESNSQPPSIAIFPLISCDQYFKDTIWKQFTTAARWGNPQMELWPIFQRYNLKAIHNLGLKGNPKFIAVTNISKIQSESNSQLK